MRIDESREMYLETMLQLEEENGVIRSIDIANALGYSKPSVSRATRVLKRDGYISHSPYGDITLTDKGREKAEKVLKTHKLLTEFLVEVLNMSPAIAEEDACRMEHVIRDETITAMEKHLGKINYNS